jgi:multicomponent Na+:H+ antiporter subunit F
VSIAVLVLAMVLGVALLLPVYRVAVGPTVFDRMVAVGVIGNKTVILVCFGGHLFGRLDMFVDIALAYAMLNFLSAIVVAKYLDRAEPEETA